MSRVVSATGVMFGVGAAYWTDVNRNDPAARADRLVRIQQQLADAVAALTSSAAWTRMLTVAARFHQYSPANILLINAQRPDATHVAGIRTWNALGRKVRRGEHGIAILAPCLYRGGPADPNPSEDAAAAAVDPKTRRGQVLRGFRVVHVFDISQTDGQPLPEVAPRLLEGDGPRRAWDRLSRLVTDDGYQLQRVDCGTANGRTNITERWVRIREDLSPAQAVKTLAHELGHIRANHDTRFRDTYHTSPQCRGIAECEAESIAYVVLSSMGMDTSDYTIPYVAAWANADIELVKATAAQCVQTAHRILSDLDHTPTETSPIRTDLTTQHPAPAQAAPWQPQTASLYESAPRHHNDDRAAHRASNAARDRRVKGRGPVVWTAEFYEDSRGRRPVEKWIDRLSPTKAAALIAAIEQVLERTDCSLPARAG